MLNFLGLQQNFPTCTQDSVKWAHRDRGHLASSLAFCFFQEKIETQKKRIASKFEAFHKFLQEQEQFLLAQLTELDKELQKLQKENVTKLSKEISHLNNLIKEVEQKCQHPASEFLQVGDNFKVRSPEFKTQNHPLWVS